MTLVLDKAEPDGLARSMTKPRRLDDELVWIVGGFDRAVPNRGRRRERARL